MGSYREINPYYGNYYAAQSGGGLPVFKGSAYQRGHGIGGFLSGMARGILPTVLPGLKSTVLKHGIGLATDVLGGQSLKESAKHRAILGGNELLTHAMRGIGNVLKRNTNANIARRPKAPKRGRPTAHTHGAKRKKKGKRVRGDIFS